MRRKLFRCSLTASSDSAEAEHNKWLEGWQHSSCVIGRLRRRSCFNSTAHPARRPWHPGGFERGSAEAESS